MAGHYIVPLKTFYKVFAALIGLTFLTVLTAKGMDLSPFNGAVAFIIATVKAALVMGIFMHLKYDAKSNSIIILSSVAFVMLLFIFCAIDIYTRIPVSSTL